MSEELSPAQRRRVIAMDAACRICPQGESTSGVLSRARQLETYLATGITNYSNQSVVSVHVGDLAISVDAPPGKLTPGIVDQVRVALQEALR